MPPSLRPLPLHTSRLTLIPYSPSLDSHCDFLVTLYNTPEVLFANKGVATSVPDRDTARRLLQENEAISVITGYWRFVVELKEAKAGNEGISIVRSEVGDVEDGVFIGNVALKLRGAPDAPTVPDLSFAFHSTFWGRGYATEACAALLEYYEKEKGVKEVLGYCAPGNENSKNMFRRLGFTDHGVRKVGGVKENARIDAYVWAKKGMKEDLTAYGIGEAMEGALEMLGTA